ncbi:pre-mRNA-splicing factor CWC22 homolog isoform X2 [Drosophila willistoni]|uniref:pre-mRNA-splicing factor CWC22 homolog isoform X2 n=1 Tax=Drosophila willistoni TaxID=7260 RepID=UPI000C26C2F4|nr:pre-mRNA-splicing factor CWC22 homolog isoform X2 [Drosophila willistoni]
MVESGAESDSNSSSDGSSSGSSNSSSSSSSSGSGSPSPSDAGSSRSRHSAKAKDVGDGDNPRGKQEVKKPATESVDDAVTEKPVAEVEKELKETETKQDDKKESKDEQHENRGENEDAAETPAIAATSKADVLEEEKATTEKITPDAPASAEHEKTVNTNGNPDVKDITDSPNHIEEGEITDDEDDLPPTEKDKPPPVSLSSAIRKPSPQEDRRRRRRSSSRSPSRRRRRTRSRTRSRSKSPIRRRSSSLERRRVERLKRHEEREKRDEERAKEREKRHRRRGERSRSHSRSRSARSKSSDPAQLTTDNATVTDPKAKITDRQRRTVDLLTSRTGGAYIPPAKLRLMQAEITDKASAAYQRIAWEALKKSIHGFINKVNVTNIAIITRELLHENIVRGRGLLSRSIIQAQAASPTFTHVYAALVAIINSKFPNIGELLLKRLVIQFRRAFRRNDKMVCMSATRFIAHLVNQRVAHEILALEILTLLVETPTDDSVEVAIAFLKECGMKLTEVSSKGIGAIFEMLRNILHEGKLDKRVQYMIEVLFQVRKDGFKDHQAIVDELELVEEDDQFTHLMMLDEATETEDILNVFKFDENFAENEEKYKGLSREILGSDASGSDGSGSGSDSGSDSDSNSNGDSGSEAEGADAGEGKPDAGDIIDNTETNLIALRRTIYLTINSSLDYEECAHKLMKMQLKPGQEVELCHMFLDCCAEQRTYEKFYGLLAQRFCNINKIYVPPFEEIFKDTYQTTHRLDTNRLRNVSKFFAHLLFTDAISWDVLECIQLNEDDTTSSSRIFIKILFQELAEYMGLGKLNNKLKEEVLIESLAGLFPKDNPRNTRFSINFFTSIGLGGLTDDLRRFLKNAPKQVPAINAEILSATVAANDSGGKNPFKDKSAKKSSSSSSSSSSDSSDEEQQKSSTSDEDSDSESSSSESSSEPQRKRKRQDTKHKKKKTKKQKLRESKKKSKKEKKRAEKEKKKASKKKSKRKRKRDQSSSSSSSQSSASTSESSSASSSSSSSEDGEPKAKITRKEQTNQSTNNIYKGRDSDDFNLEGPVAASPQSNGHAVRRDRRERRRSEEHRDDRRTRDNDRDRANDREKERDRARERDRGFDKERERDRISGRDRNRGTEKERERDRNKRAEREPERDRDRDRHRERDRDNSRRERDRSPHRGYRRRSVSKGRS